MTNQTQFRFTEEEREKLNLFLKDCCNHSPLFDTTIDRIESIVSNRVEAELSHKDEALSKWVVENNKTQDELNQAERRIKELEAASVQPDLVLPSEETIQEMAAVLYRTHTKEETPDGIKTHWDFKEQARAICKWLSDRRLNPSKSSRTGGDGNEII